MAVHARFEEEQTDEGAFEREFGAFRDGAAQDLGGPIEEINSGD